MTTEEFSNEFDALLNSYANVPSYGKSPSTTELDEYEKSLFLSSSQEEIIKELYSGKNTNNGSFESTEELRRSLGNLIKTYRTSREVTGEGLSHNSTLFNIPKDVWFITYESATIKTRECKGYKEVSVMPVTQDSYYRIANNPFKKDNERRILRLDVSSNIVELISNYSIVEYTIRYLSKPTPIILVDLDNLSIDGISTRTECSLNPILHRYILDRAVQKALISKSLLNK